MPALSYVNQESLQYGILHDQLLDCSPSICSKKVVLSGDTKVYSYDREEPLDV